MGGGSRSLSSASLRSWLLRVTSSPHVTNAFRAGLQVLFKTGGSLCIWGWPGLQSSRTPKATQLIKRLKSKTNRKQNNHTRILPFMLGVGPNGHRPYHSSLFGINLSFPLNWISCGNCASSLFNPWEETKPVEWSFVFIVLKNETWIMVFLLYSSGWLTWTSLY